MNDVKLINLFFARNEAALTETQARYGAYCMSIAARVLPTQQDAEEVLNDVWLSLWNAIPPQRPDNLKAYIGKITRNLALSKLQKETRIKRGGGVITEAIDELSEVLPSGSDPQADLEGKELSALISRFLREQPVERRKLFVQRYFYFLSVNDLHEETGMSKNNINVTLMRIRNKLQEFLKEEGYNV